MSEKNIIIPEKNMIATVVGAIIFVLVLCTLVFFTIQEGRKTSFNEGYKSGQIDAIHGNIKYQLITNTDSSKTWVELKK